ncbi:TPA: hypothetical protein HA231_03935 [Candidatus Woesearchaeota archaeon]|nr:hypothetical protein [Candidatus Woesearchaeota archaeon]
MPQTRMLQVDTLPGTRLYPENTQAQGYTNIGGKLYFRKPIGELTANELAMWHNQRIDKTLEEIEPQLRSQPLYALAEEGVFATNKSGARIPRFRIELVNALAASSPGLISPDDLEAKVMRENGSDFTQQEYTAMANELYRSLVSAARGYVPLNGEKTPDILTRWLSGETKNPAETIRSWLTGRTLAPDSYETFGYLSHATGSETFREWHGQSNDTAGLSTGFWRDYSFYVLFRQDAGNYLKRGKPDIRKLVNNTEGKAYSTRQPKSGFDGLHNAVRSAFSQFVGEFNDDFSPVRVESVQRIKVEHNGSRQHEETAKDLPKLARGLYTGEPVTGMEVLSLADLVNQQGFFKSLIGIATEKYIDGVASGQYASTPLAAEAAKTYKRLTQGSRYIEAIFNSRISWAAMQRAGLMKDTKRFGAPVAQKNGLTKDESRDVNVVIDVMGKFLADAVLTGAMDDAFGLSPEPDKQLPVYSLFERYARITAALPQTYIEFLNKSFTLGNLPTKGASRSVRRKLEQDTNNAKDALWKTYGFKEGQAGKGFLLEDVYGFIWDYFMKQSKLPQQDESDRLAWESKSPAARRRLTEAEAMAYVISNSTLGINAALDPERIKDSLAVRLCWHEHGSEYYTSQEAQAILARHGLPELFGLIPTANFAFEAEDGMVRK